MEPQPNITDWITAIAAIFAAVGTVGAVVVALWQSARRDKPDVRVTCEIGHRMVDEKVKRFVLVRATNHGYRPVRLITWYLRLSSGGRTYAAYHTDSDQLPMTLQEGEGAEFWVHKVVLGPAPDEPDTPGPIYSVLAGVTDASGDSYTAPLPGVEMKRQPWYALRRRPVRTQIG